MRKYWILAAVLMIAISISACGSKASTEEPQQQVKEPAKPDVETVKPEQQSEDADNEQDGDSSERIDSNDSSAAQEGAFRIPDFTSEDFNGNKITNEIFTNNKLTIVNIWTTT